MRCTRRATELLQHYFLLGQRKVVLLFCAARNDKVARLSSLDAAVSISASSNYKFTSCRRNALCSSTSNATLCIVDLEKKNHYRKRALRFNQNCDRFAGWIWFIFSTWCSRILQSQSRSHRWEWFEQWGNLIIRPEIDFDWNLTDSTGVDSVLFYSTGD
jgi:hypothetical protein